VVALTFDDGPNGRCTEAVLDALAAVDAPATFFLVGRNVATGQNDALLARMLRDGHLIGVHSHRHWVGPTLVGSLSLKDLREAIAAVDDGLRRAGVNDPPPIRFFRPPFGLLTAPEARAAAQLNLHIIEWTISVEDWRRDREPSTVTAEILSLVRPGDVIVLHDGHGTHQRSVERCTDRSATASTVRQLIPALRARGLEPASLPTLLGLPEHPPSPP
jgi:peptidoglycan/xylan/chitin deacetylase (PgdA/CDA1 family)